MRLSRSRQSRLPYRPLALGEVPLLEELGGYLENGFLLRQDAFIDEVVGVHGLGLGETFAIADLEEV